MVLKIYALSWILVAAAAGLLYFTGNLNEVTQVVLGFIIATILATGVMGVLPWWMDKKFTWKY